MRIYLATWHQMQTFSFLAFHVLFICHQFHLVHGGFFDFVQSGACLFKQECCNSKSIPADINKLRQALHDQVFGQHIAVDLVVNAIAAHWSSPHARKPLTMSFHGYTGSGKNYVSQIIAESLYKKGMNSKYVKLFNAGVDFAEKEQVENYKRQLYDTIKQKVQECGRQLFIFDEVHHIPPGVLDGIKAVIDYHENVDNVDYRGCIFIFLSNVGTNHITNQFLQLWRNGRKREDIRLSDFESMISQGAFNSDGGFFRSETIKNNLIDHYVPFLPMEREHVEQCIRLEFWIRDVHFPDDSSIKEVIDFIEWGPLPEKKFAKTGCKRVSQKVALIAFRTTRNQLERHEL